MSDHSCVLPPGQPQPTVASQAYAARACRRIAQSNVHLKRVRLPARAQLEAGAAEDAASVFSEDLTRARLVAGGFVRQGVTE